MEQNTTGDLFAVQINQTASGYLNETARWAKFFAILGFISIGLMILGGLIFSVLMKSISRGMEGAPSMVMGAYGAGMTFVFVLIGLLYFFPCLYLNNFANKMKFALRNNDQEKLDQAFKNLKSCFRFIGILTIVIISIYILLFLFGGLGAMFGASRY